MSSSVYDVIHLRPNGLFILFMLFYDDIHLYSSMTMYDDNMLTLERLWNDVECGPNDDILSSTAHFIRV